MAPLTGVKGVKIWRGNTINGKPPTTEDYQRHERKNSCASENTIRANEESKAPGGEKDKSHPLRSQKPALGERKPGFKMRSSQSSGSSRTSQIKGKKKVAGGPKERKKSDPRKLVFSASSCISQRLIPARPAPDERDETERRIPWDVLPVCSVDEQAAAILVSMTRGFGPSCLPPDFEDRRNARYQNIIGGDETDDAE